MKEISFGRTFPRPPKVMASLAGFIRLPDGSGDTRWGVKTAVSAVTENKVKVFLNSYDTEVERLDIAWIACL